ncbi:hypothetical protein Q8F55_009301 [Vanrija albida]|uniref:EXPERA domain-containing protein n=1 Tax=Vanrija albida TaxID=181172 RepID=A0ABR3PTI2_9TREE
MSTFTVPQWIRLWLGLSTIIVIWDIGYCFMRPRSMPGGDLSWLWGPYNLFPYADVDWVYGFDAYNSGDGFTNAQAFMNVVEVILNLTTYFLGDSPAAPVTGLIALVMTASKTDLYFLQDYFCGWCKTGHNSPAVWWGVFFATNGMWIIVPTIASLVLASGLIQLLVANARTSRNGSAKVKAL